jgi:hypothetical protein
MPFSILRMLVGFISTDFKTKAELPLWREKINVAYCYKHIDFLTVQHTFLQVSGLFNSSADFSTAQRTFQQLSGLLNNSADFSTAQQTFSQLSGLFNTEHSSADFFTF